MSENPTVEVLLSTYNGAYYLPGQLDSLVGQTYRRLRVRVRDDGSSDGTLRIIQEYARSFYDLVLTEGRNVGPVGSFFTLLDSVAEDAQYAAFCDQDDVWDPEKISVAIDALQKCRTTEPAMYCSAVRLVDADLAPIGVRNPAPRGPGFENALVQNIAAGCTIVLNRPAIEVLARRRRRLSYIRMHDWWCYQVISGLGYVHFDETPRMAYRQHAGNAVGSRLGLRLWMRRASRFRRHGSSGLLAQALELSRVHGDELRQPESQNLEAFIGNVGGASFWRRFRYVLSSPAHRQRFLEDIAMRLLIGFGRK